MSVSCNNEKRKDALNLKPKNELKTDSVNSYNELTEIQNRKTVSNSDHNTDNSEIENIEQFSQIIKDLDKDGIKDSISFERQKGIIICKLSTNNFQSIYSLPELSDEMNSDIRGTTNGFEFYVNYMRAGFSNQFRYEEKDKKIRLIGMSRYEFGPANNDGSGKSSVNLLTNEYIGEWNYYDLKKDKLIKMPIIKSKMYFPKLYLENYNGKYQSEYEEKCSALYYKQKQKCIK